MTLIGRLVNHVTSFADMILSMSRIEKTIEQEEAEMRAFYIGVAVIETLPNGSKRGATITQIDYCPSCRLHGNFLMYISYTDDKTFVPGAWVGKDVLTFSGGE